ncbi:MAG: Trigger factor [Candidatus Nomurabacteria bacterium GW2011_GWF1_42_40]|nr:MAG: Trigger factor [Candidatus Nomurabacteria bacterium GW2011_GWF1_42_40]
MLKVAVKKLPKSEVEIEGELEPEIFESYFAKALKKIGETLKLDGFRKGKVPENVLLSKVPEIRILEEMAELALSEHYPKIIESEKIDAISRPEISITKLARHNPLGFKIKTAMLPQIKLPDYKGIAKKIISGMTDAEKNVAVTDEDLESTIMDIRKSRAPKIHMADVSVDDSTPPKPSPEGRASSPSEKAGDEVKSELPEFNDEFVRALGPFKNVADFRAKLKENIKLEKENQQKEKTRLKIIEKIIDESALEVPEILIGIELDKILYRMESDITQMGLKFEDYLKHLSKTKDDLRKEFRKDAEKKAKLALILNEIAKAEKMVADPEQVAKEVAAILEHYKDADPERARMHAENVLTNEKIFQFLESQ